MNRGGAHAHTHSAPAPPHHILARHAPYTQTPRDKRRTVRPGRRRASVGANPGCGEFWRPDRSRRSYVTLPADLWPPTRHWRPGHSRQSTITLAAALQTPTWAGPTPNISQACWRQSNASLTAARQPPTGLFGGHSTAGYLTELWRQKRQVPTADGRCGLGGQSVSRQSCVRLPAARLPPN